MWRDLINLALSMLFLGYGMYLAINGDVHGTLLSFILAELLFLKMKLT